MSPRTPFDLDSRLPSVSSFGGGFNLNSNPNPLSLPTLGSESEPAVAGPPEDELQKLRRQNAFLLQALTEQRQQIEYLTSRLPPPQQLPALAQPIVDRALRTVPIRQN